MEIRPKTSPSSETVNSCCRRFGIAVYNLSPDKNTEYRALSVPDVCILDIVGSFYSLSCNAIQTSGYMHLHAVRSSRRMPQDSDRPYPAADSTNADTSALERLVEDFLRSKRRNSQAYATSAESVLERFVEWCGRRGATLERIDDNDRILREYAKHLQRRVDGDGIAASTANAYFSYVSACLSYGVRDGVLTRNPALSASAQEELPTAEQTQADQQFWTPAQREELVAYVDERARTVINDRAFDAYIEARDRAIVAVLAYTGVRGAEVFRHPQDDRDGRQGLRWGRVDLDAGTARVLGKSKEESKRWQETSLVKPAREALRQLKRVQRPPTDDWPVFETAHAPSLHRAADAVLSETTKVEALETYGGIREVLRHHEITPPALTTDGARRLMQRLTEAAEIDVPNGTYLQPHGARRGIGEAVYREDREQAQDLLRHQSLSTTKDHYQHIDAAERTEELDETLGFEDDA